jgi:hypothetical protein
MSEGLKTFYRLFAYFYESKYGLEARKKIVDLGIKNIVVSQGQVEIYLEHPGRIIGPKGTNITELMNFFAGQSIRIIEVENPTNNILNCLNDRCLICGKEIKEEFKCLDLNSDANFCSDKCRDEYIYEESLW